MRRQYRFVGASILKMTVQWMPSMTILSILRILSKNPFSFNDPGTKNCGGDAGV